MDQDRPWSLPQRVAFRFGALYLAIYTVVDGNTASFPLNLLLKDYEAPSWYVRPIDAVVRTLAHALGLGDDVSAADNGSGDRLGNYLLVACVAVLAVAGAAVWSVVDRRRLDYRRELGWLRILVRYVLASTMLTYGFDKVLPTQFPLPGPTRLLETYGASSPMGLLWTFMGSSPAYTMFGGWSETIGALLLLSRRTATLGALVLIAVLTNVVMMNLCYDVCVKLESSYLLLLAVFLAAPQFGRLLDVLVRHRQVLPENLGEPPFASGSRAARRARLLLKVLVVAAMILSPAIAVTKSYFAYGAGAPRSPLDGAYDVSELRRDGEVAPPLLTDVRYVEHIAMSRGGARLIHVDGSYERFAVAYDPATGRGTLTAKGGAALALARVDGIGLEIDGSLDAVHLTIRARPADPSHLLLLSRKFHWISEAPFNR